MINDCISRTQALKELKESADHHANDSREKALLRRDRDIIRALPPVTPQEPRWIPVSEKLPEESGNYLCTFGASNTVGDDYFTTELDAKRIFGDDFGDWVGGWKTLNVTAWMPLPKAYKPKGSEDK